MLKSQLQSLPLYHYQSSSLTSPNSIVGWSFSTSNALTMLVTSINPKQPFAIAIFNASAMICFDVVNSTVMVYFRA